jgi:methionine synthase I (cobalamin-dependent)
MSCLAPVVDFFVLETFSDLENSRKAFARLRDFRRQIVLSLAWIYENGFRLRSGETVKQVIQEIRYWPLLAFGANCALGTSLLCEIGAILAEECPFDIWIKSNAGQPRKVGDRFVYDQQPEEFASDLEPLIGVVRYLGGCCGTTEDHIRALKRKIGSCYD